MKKREKSVLEIKEELFERYSILANCKEDIEKAFNCLCESYRKGGKLLVAGNGGSAADSEHIVGELMKSLLFFRKTSPDLQENLVKHFGTDGNQLADKLEGALPAIPLTSMPALTSAFANDVDATVSFAQMLYGYGSNKDVFLGITTSGNSQNIVYAFMVAKAIGMSSIALTGENGGRCKELADILIRVPERETFKVQELHLPIYHALCAMLEAEFFEER